MATIKAIEGRSVHQIQSGQVIVDLCSVVKELVENSLDAGATSIDVRFKNHGFDSIEVQDNGEGITSENYETIALKHYTSKLSSYEDLTSLQTFGFRGEALSSLCALSSFHIITARADEAPKGTRLDFEVSGKLKSTSVVASQKGTTVAVENLFQNLPVRRRELEKNIKREYGKVLGILHAYACISTGVRFAVSNQITKGKKVAVFSTKSNSTTKENIANVYGAKTLLALAKLDLTFEMQPGARPTQGARNWTTQEDVASRDVQIVGHISRPVFGGGRQTPDRQMFFVNSRPCGLPQVAKAFNEIYRSYNVTQSPFILANLILDTNAYDVNVSPDKRTILLHDQTTLLESLRASLTELFESQDQSVPHSQLGVRKLPSYIPPTVNRQPSIQEERTVFACTADGDHDSGQDHYETPGDSTQTEATKQSGTPISLIQNWVGRDANGRSQQPAPRHKSNGVFKDKQKLSRALGLKNGEAPSSYESEDTQLVAEFDETDPTQAQDISRPVQDFNARMASQQAKATQQQPPPLSPSTDSGTIPVITATPRKPTPGPVQNAFDRMRPQRTPVETATITVGDNTTFTRIGTSATKRRKCQTLKDSSSTSKFGASPLFGKSLRAFAAPGTQAGSGEDGEEEGDEDTSQQEPELELANSALESEPEGSEATSDPEDASQDQKVDASPALPGAMPEENPSLLLSDGGGSDDEYIDEGEKKAREEAKVAQMIRSAEEVAARPTQANLKRATTVLKGRAGHRSSTLELVRFLETSAARVDQQLARLTDALQPYALKEANKDTVVGDDIADEAAEERLSLTVAKPDFARMRVVGQFNLGFILATRSSPTTESTAASDELFIIDQHASDEKYNFERLQRETVVQNQRLVGPKVLDLTAIEEEIIDAHSEALAKNGFVVEIDTSGDSHVGQRCRLLTLPMSKEVVFDTRDLEELLALLSERAGSGIPRPSKVRRMFAMRACRSSIMVGKALTTKRMESVVRHMGEIDKPWNCPHGRPTMRHLAGLDAWEGWSEGDQAADDEYGLASRKTDWEGYMRGKTKSVAPSEVGETGEDALEEDG